MRGANEGREMKGNGGAVGNERGLGRGGALVKAGESVMEGQKLNLVENLVEYQEDYWVENCCCICHL